MLKSEGHNVGADDPFQKCDMFWGSYQKDVGKLKIPSFKLFYSNNT